MRLWAHILTTVANLGSKKPHMHNTYTLARKKSITGNSSSVFALFRLHLALLHVGHVAVSTGPEMRQVADGKPGRHVHLCCHHDDCDVIPQEREDEECCTARLRAN
jgi:hypothetical protein